MEPSNNEIGPITQTERIGVVDALRGLAVGGILIGNLQWFSGYGFMPPALVDLTPVSDHAARFLVHFFIEGKFYSIFSLLFGFGFALQIARAEDRGDAGALTFKRRLRWLFVIGAAHGFLLWMGDILMLYALLGFALLLFRRKTERQLLKWAIILTIVPVVVYAVFLALFLAFAPADVDAQVAAGQAGMWNNSLAVVPKGSYWEIFSQFNLQMLAGRWAGLIFQMRLPKVFAMFLLGVYIYRRGYLHDIAANSQFIRRVMIYGLSIGIVGNAIFATFAHSEFDLPPSWSGLVGVAAYAIGVPALALGIAAAFVTMWQSETLRRFASVLVPVGKMALTNYLMQTVICVAIFYGYGFGYYGRFGSVRSTLVALAIFAAQIIASTAWFKYFRFGPVEWVWRQLTYGKRLSITHNSKKVT